MRSVRFLLVGLLNLVCFSYLTWATADAKDLTKSEITADVFCKNLTNHINSIEAHQPIEKSVDTPLKLMKRVFDEWQKGEASFIQIRPNDDNFILTERALSVGLGLSPDSNVIYDVSELKNFPKIMNRFELIILAEDFLNLSDKVTDEIKIIAKNRRINVSVVWNGKTETIAAQQKSKIDALLLGHDSVFLNLPEAKRVCQVN